MQILSKSERKAQGRDMWHDVRKDFGRLYSVW